MPFAERLRGILQKHDKIMKKVNLRLWAKDFAALEVSRGPAEVKETLDLYAEHFDYEYMPQAYSARSFSEKYIRIRDNAAKASGNRNGKAEENLIW